MENIYIKEILRPSQLDICFSEKCNLNCNYCFVNKTSPDELDLRTVKKAIDTFYTLPNKDKTITFTTSEPFLYPDMFMGAVSYIFSEAGKKKINIKVVATTNGILFNAKLRKFVSKLDERFTLNFSLDGDTRSHDMHRKFGKDSKASSCEKAMKNFDQFEKKGNVRVIATVTPETVRYLRKNARFIMDNGFANVDFFPQMFALWSKDDIEELKKQLDRVVGDFNCRKIKGNLRLLNRLWGATHYAKVLFGADGKFYLFEWVLPLKNIQRKSFIIGDAGKINMKKREALFCLLFENTEIKTSNVCAFCENMVFCSNPLPLYLWCLHNRKDFDLYFDNFCQLAKVMIGASAKLKNKNKTDSEKWAKIF